LVSHVVAILEDAMKKVLLLPLVGALMLVLAPTAQAATVADVELINATINKAGVVRVVGEVTCPASYEITRNRATIAQFGEEGDEDDLVSPVRHFRAQVNCSGNPDRFTVRFRTSTTDEEFAAGELTEVSLSFTACSPKPDSVCVNASDVTTVEL
jgi:hypothetical protein